MKEFNDKHEVIIEYYYQAEKGAQEGQLAKHHKRVSKIYFYEKRIVNDMEVFNRVELSKDMITDIYRQVCEIELQTIERIFEDIPF